MNYLLPLATIIIGLFFVLFGLYSIKKKVYGIPEPEINVSIREKENKKMFWILVLASIIFGLLWIIAGIWILIHV